MSSKKKDTWMGNLVGGAQAASHEVSNSQFEQRLALVSGLNQAAQVQTAANTAAAAAPAAALPVPAQATTPAFTGSPLPGSNGPRATDEAALGAALAASTEEAFSVRRVRIEAIRPREEDIRVINHGHVVELATSIAAVGMLQFPVVDQHNQLIAGAHRFVALQLLAEMSTAEDEKIRETFQVGEDPERLTDEEVALLRGAYEREFKEGIVVRVFNTSGYSDALEIRLEVEAIENEKRRDFTREELINIVHRFKAAGYKDTSGRPKEGQRILSRELERVMGKSRRTVFRLLEDLRNGGAGPERREKSGTSKQVERELTEQLETVVSVREGDGQTGSITIRYVSYKQRGELLRRLGVKK